MCALLRLLSFRGCPLLVGDGIMGGAMAYSGQSTYLKESLDLVFRQANLEILHRGGHLRDVDATTAVCVPLVEDPPHVNHNYEQFGERER